LTKFTRFGTSNDGYLKGKEAYLTTRAKVIEAACSREITET